MLVVRIRTCYLDGRRNHRYFCIQPFSRPQPGLYDHEHIETGMKIDYYLFTCRCESGQSRVCRQSRIFENHCNHRPAMIPALSFWLPTSLNFSRAVALLHRRIVRGVAGERDVVAALICGYRRLDACIDSEPAIGPCSKMHEELSAICEPEDRARDWVTGYLPGTA